MKVVIDIPEVFYKTLKKADAIVSGQRRGKTLMSVIFNAVRNGTPLPKSHGRLKDVDALLKQTHGGDWNGAGFSSEYVYVRDIINAPTIIEADKAESEVEE